MNRRNPIFGLLAICVAILLPCGSFAELASADESRTVQSAPILAVSLFHSHSAVTATAGIRHAKQTPLQAAIDTLSLPSQGFTRVFGNQGSPSHQWRPGDARVISDRAPPDSASRI